MNPIALVVYVLVGLDTTSSRLEYIPESLSREVELYYTYRGEGIPYRFIRLLEEYQEDSSDGELLLAAAKKCNPTFIKTKGLVSTAMYGKRGTTIGSIVFISVDLTADLFVHELVHVYQNYKYGSKLSLGYVANSLIAEITNTFGNRYDFIQVMEEEASIIQERFWFWLVRRYRELVVGM
jgi:hypothetical protein